MNGSASIASVGHSHSSRIRSRSLSRSVDSLTSRNLVRAPYCRSRMMVMADLLSSFTVAGASSVPSAIQIGVGTLQRRPKSASSCRYTTVSSVSDDNAMSSDSVVLRDVSFCRWLCHANAPELSNRCAAPVVSGILKSIDLLGLRLSMLAACAIARARYVCSSRPAYFIH